MRRDVQEIFRLTPHEKQVMMFSATLSKEMRVVCKKFMQDVIIIFFMVIRCITNFHYSSVVYIWIYIHYSHLNNLNQFQFNYAMSDLRLTFIKRSSTLSYYQLILLIHCHWQRLIISIKCSMLVRCHRIIISTNPPSTINQFLYAMITVLSVICAHVVIFNRITAIFFVSFS